MGSLPDATGHQKNEILHMVYITRAYYIGKYEVTERQYQQVMGLQGDLDEPNTAMGRVSWEDAEKFCRQASAKVGKAVALPTEAQWEYACRAGTDTVYNMGNDIAALDAAGWYADNSNNEPRAVAQKKPNAWGLYGMHGNMWEWCADKYTEYPAGISVDPTFPNDQTRVVLRGGGFDSASTSCRAAYRKSENPTELQSSYGFRVVVVLPAHTDLVSDEGSSQ